MKLEVMRSSRRNPGRISISNAFTTDLFHLRQPYARDVSTYGTTARWSTLVSIQFAGTTKLSLCRKRPWRLSPPQKARQRKRLKLVDKVVDTVSAALQRNGIGSNKAVERWYKEMPREDEMLPKDKYTIFDRKEKRYRKGIHSTFASQSALF